MRYAQQTGAKRRTDKGEGWGRTWELCNTTIRQKTTKVSSGDEGSQVLVCARTQGSLEAASLVRSMLNSCRARVRQHHRRHTQFMTYHGRRAEPIYAREHCRGGEAEGARSRGAVCGVNDFVVSSSSTPRRHNPKMERIFPWLVLGFCSAIFHRGPFFPVVAKSPRLPTWDASDVDPTTGCDGPTTCCKGPHNTANHLSDRPTCPPGRV